MSDQIQETQQPEVHETVTPSAAPAQEKKDNWFLKIWRNRNKRSIFMLAVCLVLILLATFVGSLVQTAGWSATVEDLRDVSNSGKITRPNDAGVDTSYDVKGYVSSGLLYIPKKASAENKVPAIVFTHGLYNNREMQLQNVIEMVRRGYVVLAIDYGGHGHNASQDQIDAGGMQANYGYTPYIFLQAAKYLYNLPIVDQSKIGVSGHSMGGGATINTLQLDGIDSTYSDQIIQQETAELNKDLKPGDSQKTLATANNDRRKAGYHLGIISAGLTQANDVTNMFGYGAPASIGSNVLAAGVLKASADEFFFNSTLKEKAYLRVSKASVNEDNYTGYYLKEKDGYVKQDQGQKFRPSKQYYTLTDSGSAYVYLNTVNAMAFVTGKSKTEVAALDAYKVANGGIYVNGELQYQPEVKVYDTLDTESGGKIERTVPKRGNLVSIQRKGEAIASAENTIRVIYEARETHPMNHFSIQSAAHVVDFFYNAFGVSPVGRYIAPTNQTWWLKEAFSMLGFLGLFGLIFPVLDMLLGTKLFASLKAAEGEIAEGPVLLTRPRKHVTYWLSGILTAIFGAYSLRNMYGNDKWHIYNSLLKMFDNEKFIYNDTVARFAAWGILCAAFAIIVSVVIWFINYCINTFVYGEDAHLHNERPFDGFKIRSWQNVLKTPLLAAIVLAVFYGVMFGVWGMSNVDFRFWTFDLRVFDLVRVPAMLQYVPFFFIFYMVTSAFSQNYRVKDLPEWATIAINVVFNVIGVVILLWASNDYFIRTGTQIATSSLFYIAAIPIIPCVGIATVIARRTYVRTGNAWLAGIINAVIMTFIACANTSLAVGAQVGWFLGA